MKKLFLDIGYDYDFVVYGIVSQEPFHRLAWLINKKLDTNFSRQDDLAFSFENEADLTISRFSYHDELNHLEFDLLANKDSTNYWIPELRKIDYFIFVKGALESFRKRKYTEPFRQIPEISIISEIHHKKLKQKERFIF
ncbi:MAG: IPExxxVDY family protein [Bacteroidia bacterium]